METGIFFGLLVAFLAYIGTFIRVRNKGGFDFVDWFIFAFGSLNGLGLAFVLWATKKALNIDFWSFWIEKYADSSLYYGIFGLILIFSVWFGATIYRKLHIKKQYIKNNVIKKYLNLKYINGLAWIFLFVALISYWIYSRAYGGFINLFFVGPYIRSGLFNYIPENPFSFLNRFGGLAFFASFLFWSLFLNKDSKAYKYFGALGFILSFSFSLFVLFTWLGRVSMAIYIFAFPLSLIISKKRFSTKVVMPMIVIFLLILGFLSISDKILSTGKGSDNLITFFAKELSFPFVSFSVQMDRGEMHYLKDLIVSPVFFLPQRVWSGRLGIYTASDVNTVLIMGGLKGESGITGGIPVDILTFSYMQLHVAGVVIVGFIWGYFLFWFDQWMLKILIGETKRIIYSYTILNFVVLTALYGDPSHIIARTFNLIIGTAILFFINRIGRARERKYCYEN